MRTRRFLLLVGVIAVLTMAGYLAYRKGYLAWDSENPEEMARLRDEKPQPPPPAPPATGSFGWRGPTADGRAPAGAFRTNWDQQKPQQLWQAECGGGYSSCAVVGGQLYTQDYKDGKERVICLDAEKGTLLWSHAYAADYAGTDSTFATGPRATPTVSGNRVFAVGAAGKLLCLEAPGESGKPPRVVWEHDLLAEFDAKIPRWGVACSPLVLGELVIVHPGGSKGAVAAFDRETGERRWASGSNPAGYSSPVAGTIGGEPVIFAFLGNALLAVRTDGTITDSYSWRTENLGNIATPLVVGDYVFISSAYGQGSALLRAEKRGDEVKFVEVYSRRGVRAFQNHHASSVYKDGHIFGFDGISGLLKCLVLDNGQQKEGWDSRGVGKGSITLADKHLIIQTERGELCLVEATSEEFRLVAKVPGVLSGHNNWATPVLVDGRLYLRDEQKVICLDVRP